MLRPGAENPATPRQPVRHEVVTLVLGTTCYPCLRADKAKGGGESVSQLPLMYKPFFIPARGNVRSWLPAIAPSRAPAAPKPPRHLRRPGRGRRPSHLRLRRQRSQAVNRLIAANDFLGPRAAVSKDYSRGEPPQV